jgi:hypothetical protein
LQADVRLCCNPVEQRCRKSRFSDAGLACDQYDGSYTDSGLRPPPHEERKLFLPADECSGYPASQRLNRLAAAASEVTAHASTGSAEPFG